MMRYFLTIAALFSLNILFSQSSFEVFYGTSNDEIVYDVKYFNNEFVAIGTQGNFQTNVYSSFLIRFDSVGNIVDTKLYNFNSSFSAFYQLEVRDDGLIVIGGVLNDSNKVNAHIVKLDSNYNVLWKRSYGSKLNDEYAVDFIIDHDTIIIYGSSYEYYPNGTTKEIDQFILKMSIIGDSIDFKIINQPWIDIPGKISKINNGYLLSNFNPDTSLTSFLVEINHDLSVEKSTLLPHGVYGIISHLPINDSIIVYCGRKDTVYNTINTRMDIGVGLINRDGSANKFTIISDQDQNVYEFEASSSLALIGNNIYVAGHSSKSIYFKLFLDSPSKIIIGKLDLDLSPNWINFYGKDSTFHYTFSINPTPDNGVIALAYTYDYLNSPNLQRDIYILKLDSTGVLPTKIIEKEVAVPFSIYPNPFNDVLRVEIQNVKEAVINMYDITGKMVLSRKVRQSADIDTKGFSSGIYIIEARFPDGRSESRKFVKE